MCPEAMRLADLVPTLLAQADPPAGGAAIWEVVVATVLGALMTAAVVVPIMGYRSGRFDALGRLAAFTGRVTGMPANAALPLAIMGGALIIAVFGMYWDISLHIDEGRDPGPLANPAHYFILVGLFGVMASGILAMALPREPSKSSVKIWPVNWDAPVGGILMAACGALSLAAFPLDDVWHRIFGQDVTLWSPTHLMLITGASLSVFGGLALYRESLEEAGARPDPERDGVSFARAGWLLAPLTGAMLIGLNTFMAEFDFSVPQFRLDFNTIGLMMASGLALVTARLVIGPWGALATVGFFLIIRGALSFAVGPIFGQTMPHFPLYLAEGIVVELVAFAFLRSGRPIDMRPVTFGAVAGIAIGTVGLAAEWAWSHIWGQTPWTESMLPEAVILGLIMAIAAGTIGGFAGRALSLRGPSLPAGPTWALPLAGAAAVAVVLYTLPISTGEGPTSATLQLTEVSPPPNRQVSAEIQVEPTDAAQDARWFNVTSWQGGGSVVGDVEQVGEGTYRSTEPIPVSGDWKSILRLHVDDAVIGLPIYMPRDTEIPAPEIPATPTIERDFVLDKENLLREAKGGVSGVVTTISYLAVLALVMLLFACLIWGLHRLRTTLGREEPPAATPAPRRPTRRAIHA